jgi:hypothetical protein
MKVNASSVLFALLFFLVATVNAQEPVSAAETADKLRAQLLDVQFQEENLKLRLQQLDEDLKPENIQRALAGIGSTRPEELRESRRRQLQIERDGIAAQLKVLETSRVRLEAAILEADARAYQESARPMQQGLIARSTRNKPLLISGGASFVLFGILASLYVRRRLRRRS